jgi:voltage-gated potassium channel
MDLITAGGKVTLVEREPQPDEIGRRPVEIGRSLIVRVVRANHEYSFWEPDVHIQQGDKLIVIRSTG